MIPTVLGLEAEPKGGNGRAHEKENKGHMVRDRIHAKQDCDSTEDKLRSDPTGILSDSNCTTVLVLPQASVTV